MEPGLYPHIFIVKHILIAWKTFPRETIQAGPHEPVSRLLDGMNKPSDRCSAQGKKSDMGLLDWFKRRKAGDTITMTIEGGGEIVTLDLPCFIQRAEPGGQVKMSADSGDYWHLFMTDKTDDRYNDQGGIDIGFACESMPVNR